MGIEASESKSGIEQKDAEDFEIPRSNIDDKKETNEKTEKDQLLDEAIDKSEQELEEAVIKDIIFEAAKNLYNEEIENNEKYKVFSEAVKNPEISEKIISSLKDLAYVHFDAMQKSDQIKKELEDGPTLEEQLKSLRENNRNLSPRKLISKECKLEHSCAIKEIRNKMLMSFSGIFKYRVLGICQELQSDIRKMEKKEFSTEQILKNINWKLFKTRVQGKYWKVLYKIYGMDIPELKNLT